MGAPQPRAPVWIPLWQFPAEADRQRADEAVEAILAKRSPSVLFLSSDMKRFDRAWPLSEGGGNEEGALFTKLGL